MATNHFDLGKAHAAVAQNMAKLRRDDTFCDLTIKCGGTSIRVYRHVLASSSDWFLKACTSNFKEGQSSVITLEDDDDEDVECMVEFCYTLSYTDADPKDCGPMTKAVRMYSLGEKYLIENLTKYAADHLTHHITNSWTEEDFFAAVKVIYTETSDLHRHLRNTVGEVLRDEFSLGTTWSDEFRQLLDTFPGLGGDAFRAVALPKSPKVASIYITKERVYRCPVQDCKALFTRTIAKNEQFRHQCSSTSCSILLTGKKWETYIVKGAQ